MVIFISFSGEAREKYALKFLDFFNNNGIKCWYDHHELYLGDELRETITKDGIQRADYCILLINKTFLEREWPCEEAMQFYDRYCKYKNIVLFPILIDISKEDLNNSKIRFLLKIKYQFLKSAEEIDKIGYQILNRIFNDIKNRKYLTSFEQIKNKFKRLTLSESVNIYNVLSTIDSLSPLNYRDKSILLICLIQLFDNSPYMNTIHNISYMIYKNYSISFDLYKIVEAIFIISSVDFLDL
ncbi:MAG: toll/interleukin-1 receptor domain-containing protein [Firmicutes bacterium]|nr:toll/interleukin-1 receptor domain-containing protein [Bacillota bacterium]